ncbi:LysE family translocator [Phaeobacter sp. J2-8]|uniref:LysE family translocator n=1 Tax=Phaeobacter sp. J2-8 TaxID=2931394 RepID=UPI001FCFFB9D|nr:LysE family translocator [Phaeobacter sp. J2-8]MCJ7872837.1 LysE family translocator [Phaeobacter sp. J2-8]
MTYDLFLALAGFAIATSVTPGPNNMMLMASGANFGVRRSIPHMLGIISGFPAMIFLVGVGVMQVFDAWPGLRDALLVASVVYMLWLAWKIATAAPPPENNTEVTSRSRPLSFLQSAGFQWINPKAWTMGISAITVYAASRDLTAILWVALIYVGAGMISTTVWVVLGQQIRRILRNPRHLRLFNILMAGLLIASLLPALMAG